MATLPYLGEPVDQRAHALQAARWAVDDGADDELVVAALLHDVARVPQVRVAGRPHAEVGAEWCLPRFGPRVAWLVGAHVAAKRYLVGADAGYHDTLSDASVESLRRQGGPMSADEQARFAAHPFSADARRLRKWDDAAKVPGGPELDVEVAIGRSAAVAR